LMVTCCSLAVVRLFLQTRFDRCALPTSDDVILFDTGAAIAYVDADNPFHEQVWDVTVDLGRGLSGHAVFEFMSVLTRLPLPKRLSSADALRLIRSEFPQNRFLPAESMDDLVDEFVRIGLTGGMVYDGLVAACARYHGLPLITCDHRAEDTYRLLGVTYRLATK